MTNLSTDPLCANNDHGSSIGSVFIPTWLGGCGSARVHAADVMGSCGDGVPNFLPKPPQPPVTSPRPPHDPITSAVWALADLQPPNHVGIKHSLYYSCPTVVIPAPDPIFIILHQFLVLSVLFILFVYRHTCSYCMEFIKGWSGFFFTSVYSRLHFHFLWHSNPEKYGKLIWEPVCSEHHIHMTFQRIFSVMTLKWSSSDLLEYMQIESQQWLECEI